MKRQTKIYLYVFLLVIGLLSFILQLFVFEAPDGRMGFLLYLISISLIINSLIQLCRLSSKIRNFIFDILDILFFIK